MKNKDTIYTGLFIVAFGLPFSIFLWAIAAAFIRIAITGEM